MAEFVNLYVDFILNKSVAAAFDAFRMGFDMVCRDTAISIFRPEEVELLVCGSSDLDFEVLRKSTSYDGGFEPETPVIQYAYKFPLLIIVIGTFGRLCRGFRRSKRSDCCFLRRGRTAFRSGVCKSSILSLPRTVPIQTGNVICVF